MAFQTPSWFTVSVSVWLSTVFAMAEPATVIYGGSSKKKETPAQEKPKAAAPSLSIATRSKPVTSSSPTPSFIRTLAPEPSSTSKNPSAQGGAAPSNFPWRKGIVTTTFWIGQGASGYNSTMNKASAWDMEWKRNYGGVDTPSKRDGILPAKFAAMQNPFYIALPFNDVKYPKIAAKWIPWWNDTFHRANRWTSQCKGRWVQIRSETGKICYAQWEDVGPFRYDHAAYVFGNERPTTYNKAGLDISPAIKQYLGLTGLDTCDWRFVEAHEVPQGPWLKYGEQAIVFAALERARKQERAARRKKKPAPKPTK